MVYNQRTPHCNRQFDDRRGISPKTGARTALALLLGINLFNYIDR